MIEELEAALAEMPILDIHTHLVGGKLAARGLARRLALSHGRQRPVRRGLSDRRAVDPVSRLAELKTRPTPASRRPLPYLEHIQNTSSFWGVRIILRELYGWTEPIDARNWRQLDALIRERADDRGLGARGPRSCADQANRHRAGPARGRRGRRPAAVRPRVGLLHAHAMGRVRHGPLRAGTLLGQVAREPRSDRRRRPARHRARDSNRSTTSTRRSPIM